LELFYSILSLCQICSVVTTLMTGLLDLVKQLDPSLARKSKRKKGQESQKVCLFFFR